MTLPATLQRRLEAIAGQQGCQVQQLVIDACSMLAQTFEEARPRRTPAKATVLTGPGMLTTMASGAVGLIQPDHVYVAKRGPGRPRKVLLNPDDRCVVCEHTRGEHCGENGKCLSMRCVCREFTA